MITWQCPCGHTINVGGDLLLPWLCKCGVRHYDPSQLRTIQAPATKMPSLRKRAVTYATSTAAWLSAGSPLRSAEEVDRIYVEHCAPCPQFKAGFCQKCGCACNTGESGLTNKIRRATEHCPLGRW